MLRKTAFTGVEGLGCHFSEVRGKQEGWELPVNLPRVGGSLVCAG